VTIPWREREATQATRQTYTLDYSFLSGVVWKRLAESERVARRVSTKRRLVNSNRNHPVQIQSGACIIKPRTLFGAADAALEAATALGDVVYRVTVCCGKSTDGRE
jgi:hypothetical protein